jgi:tRNA A22 N-methylase
MLDQNKAQKVIIADVSAKCLSKAEMLLSEYVACGKAESRVSDGFDNVGDCSVALIAGMGGEEIVHILKKAVILPEKLVLQPMKNCDKVRYFVVEKGYKIQRDVVFKASGKFYDLLVLEKGKDHLTSEEAEFARDNVKEKNADFVEMIKIRIDKYNEYLNSIVGEKRKGLEAQIERLSKYV